MQISVVTFKQLQSIRREVSLFILSLRKCVEQNVIFEIYSSTGLTKGQLNKSVIFTI